LGLGLPVATTAAAAEGRKIQADVGKLAEAPALEMKDDKVQLSLDQAIEIALQRNLGLVVERYTRTEQRLSLFGNTGIYDLGTQVTLEGDKSESSGISRLQGTKSDTEIANLTLTQAVPTGGGFTFGWNNSRNSGASTVSSTLTTSYSSTPSLSFTQPLLRGRGRIPFEHSLLVARNASDVGRETFGLQVSGIVQQVVNAYWGLVNAREQLVVAEESLALAKELHERNRIQVDVGTMAPLELVQSEAAIATREEDIIRATSAVGDAEDVLRRLLNVPGGDLWTKEILPVTPPETEHIAIDLDESIKTALASRAEIRAQQLAVDKARLDAAVSRNGLLPGLNLTLKNTLNGGAKTFREAFDQATGYDFPGWTASLVFSYPIQNRAARAQAAVDNLEVDRNLTLLDQQKLIVQTEVRTAARAVQTAAKTIDAARKAREFQEKNLDAEKKRYENGMSTSFQITRVQDDLTQARSSEVSATIAYRTALAEYYRTLGKLLDNEGVTIDDPQDVIHRFGFSRPPLPGE
jgi:outer membrane protein TolC